MLIRLGGHRKAPGGGRGRGERPSSDGYLRLKLPGGLCVFRDPVLLRGHTPEGRETGSGIRGEYHETAGKDPALWGQRP
jgi:hypothetical protein